jgi:hypothetical protein
MFFPEATRNIYIYIKQWGSGSPFFKVRSKISKKVKERSRLVVLRLRVALLLFSTHACI